MLTVHAVTNHGDVRWLEDYESFGDACRFARELSKNFADGSVQMQVTGTNPISGTPVVEAYLKGWTVFPAWANRKNSGD